MAKKDGVGVWDINSKTWTIEGLRGVKGIRCVAWRPWGGKMLAVGSEAGIILWVLENGKVIWLKEWGFHGVRGLDWSPDGRMLIGRSGEEGNGKIVLWDVGRRDATVLGKGCGEVSWSPDCGRYLFMGGEKGSFKIWDVMRGKTEKFKSLGKVKAAAWSRDGTMVAVGCRNEEAIHVLRLNSGKGSAELARVVYTEPTGVPEVGAGGDALVMAWDRYGERLAVGFAKEKTQDDEYAEGNLVGLYATSAAPYFNASPIGYIRGPSGSGRAVSLKFHPRPNSAKGAILAIAWAGGCISFVQMAFLPQHRADGF